MVLKAIEKNVERTENQKEKQGGKKRLKRNLAFIKNKIFTGLKGAVMNKKGQFKLYTEKRGATFTRLNYF